MYILDNKNIMLVYNRILLVSSGGIICIQCSVALTRAPVARLGARFSLRVVWIAVLQRYLVAISNQK